MVDDQRHPFGRTLLHHRRDSTAGLSHRIVLVGIPLPCVPQRVNDDDVRVESLQRPLNARTVRVPLDHADGSKLHGIDLQDAQGILQQLILLCGQPRRHAQQVKLQTLPVVLCLKE